MVEHVRDASAMDPLGIASLADRALRNEVQTDVRVHVLPDKQGAPTLRSQSELAPSQERALSKYHHWWLCLLPEQEETAASWIPTHPVRHWMCFPIVSGGRRCGAWTYTLRPQRPVTRHQLSTVFC